MVGVSTSFLSASSQRRMIKNHWKKNMKLRGFENAKSIRSDEKTVVMALY